MAVATREWTTKKGEVRKAYVVRYHHSDGKYRLKTFKTRKAAKARDAQIKVDLDKGVHQPDSTAKTIGEAGEFWLGICEVEGVEPEAIRNYRTHFDHHIKPALAPEKIPDAWKGEFGALKLSRLTGPVGEAFRLRVMKSPARNWRGQIIPGRIIARRTQQYVWASFQQMLNVAVKHGLMPYHPAHTIRLDTKEREKVRIRIGEQIPDRPDVRDIVAASNGKWRVLFSLDSFSGLRSGEIRALSWSTVYLRRA
jgi:integrase